MQSCCWQFLNWWLKARLTNDSVGCLGTAGAASARSGPFGTASSQGHQDRGHSHMFLACAHALVRHQARTSLASMPDPEMCASRRALLPGCDREGERRTIGRELLGHPLLAIESVPLVRQGIERFLRLALARHDLLARKLSVVLEACGSRQTQVVYGVGVEIARTHARQVQVEIRFGITSGLPCRDILEV